jgi:raffinose/stachyose/melibiose transport system substrate-binding protein
MGDAMLKIPAAAGRQRRVAAALVSVAALALAAACSSGNGSSSGGSATSGSINWWGWTPDAGPANQYIAAFNKEYPNVKVTYKQLSIADYDAGLRPALASSVGPDVFDVAPGAANGSVQQYHVNAVDLTPSVDKALGSTWKTQLAPIGVEPMTVGKKLVGMSVGSTFAGILWINKDLFDKYNLTPPKTLDEWVKACQTFKAAGQGCFVQGASQTAFNEDTLQAITDNIEPGLWVKAIAGQEKFTNPSIVKALTIWKSLFTSGIMQEGALGMQQYPDANNAFMSGKYAMVMMGTWYMQYSTMPGMTAAISGAGVASAKPFTQLAIPFPDVAGTGKTGQLFGDADYGLAVNGKSKHRNAAITFATWMGTSKVGQQVVANVLNNVPSLNSVQVDWNAAQLVNAAVQRPVLEKLIQQAGTTNEPRLATVKADLQTAIGDATTTVAAGKATPEKAAETLQAAAAKIR